MENPFADDDQQHDQPKDQGDAHFPLQMEKYPASPFLHIH
jgi:hypothetical protein